jgi:hypothetical protein
LQEDPYLVAFQSGFGDGKHEWRVLKDGRETIGFACEVVDTDARD